MEIDPVANKILSDEDVEMEEQQTLPILPDEILLKIFEELSRTDGKKDLLNATLVCKRWNDLISKSSRILKNWTLSINLSGESFLDDINSGSFKITRKYSKLLITGDVISDSSPITQETYTKLLDVIKASLGDHLISLRLRRLTSKKLRLLDLVKLLSCCRVIENLDLKTVDLDEVGSENLEFAKLMKLTIICLVRTSARILDFIECTTLKLFAIHFQVSSEDCVIKFMNKLDCVDKLFVINFATKSKISLQPKFCWNNLTLFNIMLPRPSSTESATAIANLEALGSASNEKATVRLLLDELKPESGIIMQRILNNCLNIEELTFGNFYPSDASQLREMKEVKKLTLDKNYVVRDNIIEEHQRRSFTATMEKTPNVKHLVLKGSECMMMLRDELVPILFANVTLLELSLNALDVLKVIQTYSYPNLTTLAIYFNDDDISSRENLKVLATFCSVNLKLKCLQVTVVNSLESSVEAEIVMFKLYTSLSHTSLENFKLQDFGGIKLEKTKGEIEMKLFTKVLSERERRHFTS